MTDTIVTTGVDTTAAAEDPYQLTEDSWRRAASLEAYGFGAEQIARVLGVPQTYFEAMQSSPIYREMLGDELGRQVEGNVQADKDWDSLENLALTRLNDVMKQGFVQKEFALAVAKTANQAHRRTRAAQRPLDERSGTRVVLNLGVQYIQKIQQGGMPQVGLPAERVVTGSQTIEHVLGASSSSTSDSEAGPQAIEHVFQSPAGALSPASPASASPASAIETDSVKRLLSMARPNLADVKKILHVPAENTDAPIDLMADQRFFRSRVFDPLDSVDSLPDEESEA